jgi:hypothetical protein
MKDVKIVTKEEWKEMTKGEIEYYDKTGRWWFDTVEFEKEIDGNLYTIQKDTRNDNLYAVPTMKSIHMGFNSNEEGKLDEFVATVEKYGECKASWGVTGRTMHEILAERLARELPQYEFEIEYNYHCVGRKKNG